MDNAVALVQAYLRVNGYFTVSEYPVLERFRHGQVRTMTDLDILGFRFPGAGRIVVHGSGKDDHEIRADPALHTSAGQPDMLIGEVKEGHAELNRACRDPDVLEVVLARFGCCPAKEARRTAKALMRSGSSRSAGGHVIRLVAFGEAPQIEERNGYLVIPLAHVVHYLRQHLREHWDVLRHAQPKDTALGFLTLLEKTRGVEAV